MANTIGAGNCFLLAVSYLRMTNSGKAHNIGMLSVLFFIIGMVILNTVLNFADYKGLVYGFEPITNALTFAIAPVLYLYIRSLSFQNQTVGLNSKHLIHFYVFLSITMVALLFPESSAGIFSSEIINGKVMIPLWNLHFLCYLGASYLLLQKNDNTKNKQPKFIFWSIAFIWALNLLFYLFRTFVHGLPNLLYLNITLLFTAVMLWFSYARLVVYNKSESLRIRNIQNGNKQLMNLNLESIVADILKNQYYRNPELNIRRLSRELDIPYHELSTLINSTYHKNFNEFINGFRIKEVEEALKSGEHTSLTIMGIAQKAGFRSSSAFYSAFKKEKGTTPKAFIARHCHSA
ncbi:helix-turn-helix domain-containing protein [Flagellimonas allohymeniacidonis]|nr:AraC family transcriptional regulator [Allomuricauda hymeniacidonis]